MTRKLITIIVPVLNEESNVILFYNTIKSVIDKIDNDFEITKIFSNPNLKESILRLE